MVRVLAMLTFLTLCSTSFALPVEDPDVCFQISPNTRRKVDFIADTDNRCAFWHCTRRGHVVLKDCAPGARLPLYYTAEDANPCVERWPVGRGLTFMEICRRPMTTTTNNPTQTLHPDFFPTEHIIENGELTAEAPFEPAGVTQYGSSFLTKPQTSTPTPRQENDRGNGKRPNRTKGKSRKKQNQQRTDDE